MANRREVFDSPAKILYKILQVLHHLSLLRDPDGTGCSTRAFSQKVYELNSFIRPALPNLGVFEALERVNKTWATSVTRVLIDHYSTQLSFLKGVIKPWRISNAERVLYRNKAHGWARQQFGKKIKNETFKELDKILDTFCLPIQNSHNARVEKAPVDPKQASEATQKHQSAESGTGERPCLPTPTKRKAKSPPCHDQELKRMRSPRKSLRNLTAPNPKEKPAPKPSCSNSYAGAAAKATTFVQPRPPPARNLFKNMSPSVHRYENISAELKRGQQIHRYWEIPKVVKDILILGTSNLSRITKVDRHDAQIASYPGFKLDHLLRLLQGFKYGPGSKDPGLKPSKVVIVAGLNDRTNAQSTNETNLKKVLNKLAECFPGSKILVLQHRFSSDLVLREQSTILKLNEAIALSCSKKEGIDFIPPIPLEKFQVSSNDHIHWLPNCANFTLQHIFQHLN